MKHSLKLALLGVAFGITSLSTFAQQRPLSPAAAAAHAANAALAQCHATVHRDIATFRALHAKAVREHAVAPVVLKRLTAHEQAIVGYEARLANHETLAQCQAEDRALKATDAELAKDIALGECHALVRKDVAVYRADLAKARKEHAVAPAVLKNLNARETAVLNHEKALGAHETVAACQAEHKALQANDALLRTDIALGECHALIRRDIAVYRADLMKAQKEHAVAPAVLKQLSLREALIVNHEKAMGTHETVAACQAENKALQANDALLRKDIAFGVCHNEIRTLQAKITKDIQTGIKSNTLKPAAVAELVKHERAILDHEKALGAHETIAQCTGAKSAMVALEKAAAPHLAAKR